MNAVDLFAAYQFVKRLVLPFNEWEAYKLGIIDAEGNVLKKRATLQGDREKNAWGYFDIIAANLKKMLAHVPGGQSKLGTYTAAFFLLKEGRDLTEDNLVDRYMSFLAEEGEAPTNSMGNGEAIASKDILLGSPSEKPLRRKKLVPPGLLEKGDA